jgi:hypothetical protein
MGGAILASALRSARRFRARGSRTTSPRKLPGALREVASPWEQSAAFRGPSGSHWSWAPGSIHSANTGATPIVGVTVAMDERLLIAASGVVNLDRPTNWFGWWPGMDPVSANVPPNSATVVPYTLRRLVWTIDWLQTRSPYAIDPQRTAVMGNSMDGAGTLLLGRFRPGRFSAANSFVPQRYTPEIGPAGGPLRVNEFFDAAIRLSPSCSRVGGRADEPGTGPAAGQGAARSAAIVRFGLMMDRPGRSGIASAFSRMSAITSAGVSPGRSARIFAARFATCGAAIEVPEKGITRPPGTTLGMRKPFA